VNFGDQTFVAIKIIIDINDYSCEWILRFKICAVLDSNSTGKVNPVSVTLPRLTDGPEKFMNPLETPSSRIRRAGIDTPAVHPLACT
jgi:hypothetical protein